MSKLFADKHAGAKTDLDAILSGKAVVEAKATEKKANNKLVEAIVSESDLLSKLTPISEVDIFSFMKNLRGGTYFNMGMFSSIPVARAFKPTFRIYKVVNMTAIVSGVSYENVGTTKDFRASTGKEAGKAWYDHAPGYENKVGLLKSNPNNKYILWDVKASSGNWVAYYLVDISTGTVSPISEDILFESDYLTQTEKNKLKPKPVTGFDVSTGALVTNETVWRTTKFEHVFWLSQSGHELGVKFEESLTGVKACEELEEAAGDVVFRDLHAGVHTDLDAILSGSVEEDCKKPLAEAADDTIPNVAYVLKTSDSLGEGFLNIDLSTEYADFSPVTSLSDLTETSYSCTRNEAINYAKEAYNATIRGWDGVVSVLEITNFEDAYLNGVVPQYNEIYKVPTVTNEDYSHLEPFECEHCGKTLYGDDYRMLYNDEYDYDEVVCHDCYNKADICESKGLKESYRRTVSCGTSLVDNELFVDFD